MSARPGIFGLQAGEDVNQGIKDQPFRNRGLLRPEGMWRLRGAIAEARPVQRAIIRTVGEGIEKVEAQVSQLSNGMVRFEDRPVARTGAAVTFNGPNAQVRVEGQVSDVRRWMPR